ncbi:MAG: hypothetical protein GF384_06460 [Elusimicrobia bacterium]|nr:hypothetical protein [Elusimicrobiota bacterium]MBD3412358.1 hypothetical protein [Elusimicrobiota bacterium]
MKTITKYFLLIWFLCHPAWCGLSSAELVCDEILPAITSRAGAITAHALYITDGDAITGMTHRFLNVHSLTPPEPDVSITALCGVDRQLVVGSTAGLFMWDEIKKQWKRTLFADHHVLDVEYDGSKIWVVTDRKVFSCEPRSRKTREHTVYGLDPAERLYDIERFGTEIWVAGGSQVFTRYGIDEDLYPVMIDQPSSDIRVCAVSGNCIAVGSNVDGVRCFSKLTEQKLYPLHDNHNAGNGFITALCADGSFIWVGTFEGFYIVDLRSGAIVDRGPSDGGLCSVEFIMPFKKSMLIGTHEGLMQVRKPYQHIIIEPVKSIFDTQMQSIPFHRTALPVDALADLRAQYRLSSFPSVWNEASVTFNDAGFTWDVSALPQTDERYELCVSVGSETDVSVQGCAVIHLDAGQPSLSFDPLIGLNGPGPVTVTGRFNKRFVKKIVINPGRIEAVIDRTHRIFKGVVNLKDGENTISAECIDAHNKHTKTYTVIYVSHP